MPPKKLYKLILTFIKTDYYTGSKYFLNKKAQSAVH